MGVFVSACRCVCALKLINLSYLCLCLSVSVPVVLRASGRRAHIEEGQGVQEEETDRGRRLAGTLSDRSVSLSPRSYARTHIYTHIYTRTHTLTHTHTHTYTQAHRHTHTHSHTCTPCAHTHTHHHVSGQIDAIALSPYSVRGVSRELGPRSLRGVSVPRGLATRHAIRHPPPSCYSSY